MDKLDLTGKNLKKFGVTMAAVFAVITLIIFLKHRHSIAPTAVISAAFLLLGAAAPFALKPVYIFWMRFAFVLSWVNTRLILLVIFYLVFTPIGLCLKLFGKDLLDIRPEKNKDTYWKKKETGYDTKESYERQF